MRNAFINTILEAAKSDKNIFIIAGDAGLGVFDEFKKEYPDRFLNLGVAEQNMISFSAGLSMSGFKVYVYNIIPFVLYRCYEQVRNDICYQGLPVTLIGTGSGITYAPQGMTHYSVEDLGIARSLPNLKVISPIDPVEAELAARYSLKNDSPLYVRIAKRGEPRIHKKDNFDITMPQLIADGSQVAIICHGSIIEETLKAKAMLDRSGISVRLISVPMVQPLDKKSLFSMLKGMKFVFSIEEHFIGSGLGSYLAAEVIKERPAWRFTSIGIRDDFIHEIKDTKGMREHFGISGAKIAEKIEKINYDYTDSK